MPRSPGQIIVTIPLDKELLALVEKARGFKTRALFIREAIVQHLIQLRIPVPEGIAQPPDRAGKGGRRTAPRGVGFNEPQTDCKT